MQLLKKKMQKTTTTKIIILIFLCLNISSIFSQEMFTAAGPIRTTETKDSLSSSDEATLCGDGTLTYLFTDQATCTPTYSTRM